MAGGWWNPCVSQLLKVFLLFFGSILWCSQSGYHHPQKYLAIFGYKLNMEAKYFIHPSILFFFFFLATYLTHV
jgi:hypothetical protein